MTAILAGCATPDFVDPGTSANHPANPAAIESPALEPSVTLSIPSDEDDTISVPETTEHSGGMHHGGSMHHKMHEPQKGGEEKPPMTHEHHGGQPKDADEKAKGHHHGHGMAK